MAIRDLGYRPYEGERLPPSHNRVVMLRHGMRRAWGSWLVKLSLFLCWLPLIFVPCLNLTVAAQRMQSGQSPLPEPAEWVHGLLGWQLWLFVSLVTLGGGSAAIAEDLTQRAFQFYFAKPVAPEQYLTGRIGALSIWTFLVCFLPALIMVLFLAGAAALGEEPSDPLVRAKVLERLGLILPALLASLLTAGVTSTAAVGMSALGRSRALTMSAWILVLFVPAVLSKIVFEVTDWPWLRLVSIPSLLGVVYDALFKLPPEGSLLWYHALPVLAAITVGSVFVAHLRLSKAEVIT